MYSFNFDNHLYSIKIYYLVLLEISIEKLNLIILPVEILLLTMYSLIKNCWENTGEVKSHKGYKL